MALCPTCRTPIPCHCHLAPPVQIRPGVYLVNNTHRKPTTDTAQQPKEARP